MRLFNPVTREYVEAMVVEHWIGRGLAEIDGVRVKYAWVEGNTDESYQWVIDKTDAAKLSQRKIVKVKYYLTVMAEVELEIQPGTDEDTVVRGYLPDIPADKFNVITADTAEIEDDETGEKREITL